MIENNLEKKLVPPYISVSKLKYMFDLFSTHTFSQITSSFLKNRGFSGSDASQTISALKFLGILEAEGSKTEKMNRLQLKGEVRSKAILDIVKTAYFKLFETVGEPNKLSKEDLYNDFVSIYGLSGRLANTAVPNFLWLCKEAGLEVSEIPEVKERKSRNRTVSKLSKAVSKTQPIRPWVSDFSTADISVEVGEFRLILPPDWDKEKTRQAIVKGKFAVIYDELSKLSPQLKITNELGKGEVA